MTDDDIFIGTEMLDRPTDHSITVNVVATVDLKVYFKYGTEYSIYTDKIVTGKFSGNNPMEVINKLSTNELLEPGYQSR